MFAEPVNSFAIIRFFLFKLKLIMELKNLFLCAYIILTLASCNQNDYNLADDTHFISLSDASDISSLLEFPVKANANDPSSRTEGTTCSAKEIESIFEVPYADGNPAFYIVNYDVGGFIILSADDRVEPIRTFSLHEKFSLDLGSYPSSLVEWLSNGSALVDNIRELNLQ